MKITSYLWEGESKWYKKSIEGYEKETKRKSNREQKHKNNIIRKTLPKLETKNTYIFTQNHNWKFNKVWHKSSEYECSRMTWSKF